MMKDILEVIWLFFLMSIMILVFTVIADIVIGAFIFHGHYLLFN